MNPESDTEKLEEETNKKKKRKSKSKITPASASESNMALLLSTLEKLSITNPLSTMMISVKDIEARVESLSQKASEYSADIETAMKEIEIENSKMIRPKKSKQTPAVDTMDAF